jgi:hypothetical protein
VSEHCLFWQSLKMFGPLTGTRQVVRIWNFFGWRTGTWQVVRIWNFLVGGQGHGRLSGLGNILADGEVARIQKIFGWWTGTRQVVGFQVLSNAENIFGKVGQNISFRNFFSFGGKDSAGSQ